MRRLSFACLDLRSSANVGSIFRTAKAFSFDTGFLIGTTPTPNRKEVLKTSLGGETMLYQYHYNFTNFQTATQDYLVIALETDGVDIRQSQNLKNKKPIILLLGNERFGIDKKYLQQCDEIVTIPHHQEVIHSLNVVTAFSIAAWVFRQSDISSI